MFALVAVVVVGSARLSEVFSADRLHSGELGDSLVAVVAVGSARSCEVLAGDRLHNGESFDSRRHCCYVCGCGCDCDCFDEMIYCNRVELWSR